MTIGCTGVGKELELLLSELELNCKNGIDPGSVIYTSYNSSIMLVHLILVSILHIFRRGLSRKKIHVTFYITE